MKKRTTKERAEPPRTMTREELQKEIQSRCDHIRSARQTLATWLIEGVPEKEIRREARMLDQMEEDVACLVRWLCNEALPPVTLQIGFVRGEDKQ